MQDELCDLLHFLLILGELAIVPYDDEIYRQQEKDFIVHEYGLELSQMPNNLHFITLQYFNMETNYKLNESGVLSVFIEDKIYKYDIADNKSQARINELIELSKQIHII